MRVNVVLSRSFGNSRNYNPLKYDVVRQYVEHTDWPSPESISTRIIRILHTYCTAWINYWTCIRAGGGIAPELTRNHMRGLFTSVLQVSDSRHLATNKRTANDVLPTLIKYVLTCRVDREITNIYNACCCNTEGYLKIWLCTKQSIELIASYFVQQCAEARSEFSFARTNPPALRHTSLTLRWTKYQSSWLLAR